MHVGCLLRPPPAHGRTQTNTARSGPCPCPSVARPCPSRGETPRLATGKLAPMGGAPSPPSQIDPMRVPHLGDGGEAGHELVRRILVEAEHGQRHGLVDPRTIPPGEVN